MSKFYVTAFLFSIITIASAQPVVTAIGSFPEPVSNNAVCAGLIEKTPYLFSFSGIDSTKTYSGIHLKCFKFNLATGKANRIPDLPDTLGKIACGVSTIKNVAYIAGGYHVFADGSEKSSNKMHRYDMVNDVFLTDGLTIPVATDDHVQVVWRDSLIFLVSGWSDNSNIPNVQIYNPSENQWSVGTSVPNNNAYKSFGASGMIIGDTIYYFGGATSAAGFKIQSWLRKGVINAQDPTNITWSFSSPDPSVVNYRGAAAVIQKRPHWVGGSSKTYNYNGIAYDGSGGVEPSNMEYIWTGTEWELKVTDNVPMDLRGIAKLNDSIAYVAGGMSSQQQVSSAVYKIYWGDKNASTRARMNPKLQAYPNPFNDYIQIDSELELDQIHLLNSIGAAVSIVMDELYRIETISLPKGIYTVVCRFDSTLVYQKMVKL
jgi:hypothetical protein